MRRWYLGCGLYGSFPVPKPVVWPIGRLCGHPQPIQIWDNFGYFYQNFTKTQIMECFVNYIVQKCFGSLKISQRTLTIILSQYNGEKKNFIEFWKLSVNPQFFQKSLISKKNLYFFTAEFSHFWGRILFVFFNCFFWPPPTKTLRTPEIHAYRLK